jgi:hypothetical protein
MHIYAYTYQTWMINIDRVTIYHAFFFFEYFISKKIILELCTVLNICQVKIYNLKMTHMKVTNCFVYDNLLFEQCQEKQPIY